MTFPTVKSDPYKPKRRVRRKRWVVWPEFVWKRILDLVPVEGGGFGPLTLAVIREANRMVVAHDSPVDTSAAPDDPTHVAEATSRVAGATAGGLGFGHGN